jgi:DNA-binding FadR family transcriptional regulator
VTSPGAKIPSRRELARQYDVSDRVAVEAVRLLAAEGFVESKSGLGSYVGSVPSANGSSAPGTRNGWAAPRSGPTWPPQASPVPGSPPASAPR